MEKNPRLLESEIEAAKLDVGYFAELVFGLENNWHHLEWYEVLDSGKRKIIIFAPRNHAKSAIFSIIYPLWAIGNNPNIRIIIASNTSTQAEAFLRAIKQVIELNDKYIQIFGRLKPAMPEKWTDTEIIVKRKKSEEPHNTVYAVGAGGAILSKRADIVIGDDILNKENTRTSEQRKKIEEWFNDILMPVLEPKTGRAIVIGTAFNLEDLLHKLMNDSTYQFKKKYQAIIKEADNTELWETYRELMIVYGIEKAHEFYNQNKVLMNEGVEVLWKERFSYQELMDIKYSSGTRSFNLMYQNEAISDETSVFKEAWIEKCKDENRSLILKYEVSQSNLGQVTIATGVDLAISEEDRADWTSITTVAKTRESKLVILNRVRGHWSPAEIRNQIKGQAEKFKPSIILVEDNAFQASLVKDMQGSTALPIRGFTTTGEKYDEEVGINSLAVYVENGQMVIPANSRDPETVDYFNEIKEQMMKFPSGHTGDDLMSLWFAVTGIRSLGSNQVKSVRVVAPMYKSVNVRG